MVMVLCARAPRHRPDLGIAGAGTVLEVEVHQKEGMRRVRPVTMVDP
jgi:hypothetical protein